MKTNYADETAIQIVISLLKQHGIRKIIASPGATNVTFIASIQNDPDFEIYSSVDERSAAYIACGMAEESGEPVVISCTGATSSRNYMPALTEAYYRKLPIIAITSSQASSKVGHLAPQVTNRTTPPIDTVKYSDTIQIVKDADDIWDCEIKVNSALLECKRNGGGPVHLNLETLMSKSYKTKELPQFRKINRITVFDQFPTLPAGKVAIFIGSHAKMTEPQSIAIDKFCEANNAVAFCDHTSSYKGKYAVNYIMMSSQVELDMKSVRPELLIHIGEVSGDYFNPSIGCKNVWRVNPDGEIRDTFKKLSNVFEMPIDYFFNHYTQNMVKGDDSYLNQCLNDLVAINSKLPDLPFSNVWVASQLHDKLPQNAVVHFSILSSLRAWNFFELDKSITSMSNVGGFGIDGCTSSLVGASLCNQDKIYYMVTGDLAFFYDMNVVGNRHIGSNVRILVINNGKGAEFRRRNHNASVLGDDTDKFIAAAGHHGNKSFNLLKHYADDLGYTYLSASSKEEFMSVYAQFVTSDKVDDPIIFEIFTTSDDDCMALSTIRRIESNPVGVMKNSAKEAAKKIFKPEVISKLKNMI